MGAIPRSGAAQPRGDLFKFYTCSRSLISGSEGLSASTTWINNKPFQCSDGRYSPQQRCSAARVEQEDFGFSRAGKTRGFWICSSCYGPGQRDRDDRDSEQVLVAPGARANTGTGQFVQAESRLCRRPRLVQVLEQRTRITGNHTATKIEHRDHQGYAD